MPLPDFLTFFSRFSHEKPGEISHFLTTPIGGENEKISLTTRRDRCYAVNPWRATPTAATANRLTNSGRTPTIGNIARHTRNGSQASRRKTLSGSGRSNWTTHSLIITPGDRIPQALLATRLRLLHLFLRKSRPKLPACWTDRRLLCDWSCALSIALNPATCATPWPLHSAFMRAWASPAPPSRLSMEFAAQLFQRRSRKSKRSLALRPVVR
jgi:hypothetical protein